MVARDLGTDKFAGIAFCLVNYDHRVIAMGMPFSKPDTFLIVDMDDPGNPAVFRPDFNRPNLPVSWDALVSPNARARLGVEFKDVWVGNNANLLFSTSLGLLLSLRLFGPNGVADFGLSIGPGQTASGRGLSRFDRAALVSSGAVGLGYERWDNPDYVLPQGSTLKIRRVVDIDLGIPAPSLPVSVRSAGKPFALPVIGARAVMIHGGTGSPDATKAGDGSSTLYVRDVRAGRWYTVTAPGESPLVRSIGKYLLGIARTQDKKREERESAGKAEFAELTKNVRWQDGIAASSAHWEAYYPGILFAIDVETGKIFQWRTNQADSEILWADDSAFYYRRANELLKVELVQSANGPVIGPVSSILKADVLLDVHAAFRGK